MSKIVLTIELNEGDTLERAIKSLQWGPPITFVGQSRDFVVSPGAAYPIADEQGTSDPSPEQIKAETRRADDDSGDKISVEATTGTGATASLKTPLGPMDGERKRGEPAPGHRRRTNAQIAEDNAYLAQSASLGGVILSESDSAAVRGTLVTNTSESTGPEVSSEDAAQDAADEAAETAQRKSDKPTLEDLRAAVGRYTAKVGAAASIGSIRDIIGCAMIDVAEANIPAAIARVEAAIARVEAATNGSIVVGVAAYDEKKALAEKGISVTGEPIGPDDSALRGDPKTETAVLAPAPGTKQEVVAAIMAYGKKYEGDVKPEDLVLTREDMPKILTKLFGDAVKTIPAIPQTPEAYGRARDAIDAATRDNPFSRAVKS